LDPAARAPGHHRKTQVMTAAASKPVVAEQMQPALDQPPVMRPLGVLPRNH